MQRNESGAALLLLVVSLISVMLMFTATAYKMQFYQLKQVHHLSQAKRYYWRAAGQLECALALVHENRFVSSFELCRARDTEKVSEVTWVVNGQQGILTSRFESVTLTQTLRIQRGKASLISGGYYEP